MKKSFKKSLTKFSINKAMKILLIGNYRVFNSRSMHLSANLIKKILINSKHKVNIIEPKVIFNKIPFKSKYIKKWLSYIDKFIIFPLTLNSKTKGYDITHICDHANAFYYFFISSKKISITCNDLINIKLAFSDSSKNKISFFGKLYQKIILHCLKKIKNITCISEKTKTDLTKFINQKHSNIKTIYLSLNESYYKMKLTIAKKEIKQFKVPDFFFLHVGADIFYKNKIGLLKIFYHLQKKIKFKNYKLIMIGDELSDELSEFIEQNNLNKSVINISNEISAKKLCAFYSMADSLIFPSIQEGFGWPIIEAQACGCPVFTTNKPPMNIIGGKGATYINPSNPIKAAETIHMNMPYSIKKVNYSINNVRNYSIEKMRLEYNNFFQSL